MSEPAEHIQTPLTAESDSPSDLLQSAYQQPSGWHWIRSALRGAIPMQLGSLFRRRGKTERAPVRQPTTGDKVQRWAEEAGIGEAITVEEGTLIKQGERIPFAYIIPEDDMAEVFLCIEKECCSIAKLPAGSIVGEISCLLDGETTAEVRIKKPGTVYRIPRKQLHGALNVPELGAELRHLIHERLLHTAKVQEELEEYREIDALDTQGLLDSISVHNALNLRDIAETLHTEGQTVERKFILTGIHRTTHELKSVEFNVLYTKKENRIDVLITGDSSEIPFDVGLPELKHVNFGYVKMRDEQNFGFFERILRYVLKDMQSLEAAIVEQHTETFIMSRKNGDIVDPAYLGAYSPITSGLKGSFVCRMSGRISHLDGFRIDDRFATIQTIAIEVERSIRHQSEAKLHVLYGLGRKEILTQLTEIADDYVESDDYRALSNEARELFDILRKGIHENAATYCRK